ncbi:DUF3159 domain-containing protein [Nocardioides ferulae]|uniref:DUF3159 domain-containing protein n=1 Tax=Nocardioides ferulae TaxID=2340821 RepID=UPI000EABA942|nr:DUF3159 domain-containing protein [Nocardioides ferulae]
MTGPDPDANPETQADSPPGTPVAQTAETVEALVRGQIAHALGGRRGIVEAAVPTLVFTALWLTTRELTPALVVSVAAAVVLLVVRLVQRSTVQFVVNALFGIGIGWFFVYLSARRGGSEEEQALAYFLPGILYNSGYAVVLALTCLVGWPLVGFMVGAVSGDPTAWHSDRQIVRLCTKLTWLLALPCFVRVIVQGPVWLGGQHGYLDADTAIGALGVLKVALGWPLQLAALGAMAWLLGRGRTPVRATG